MGTQLYRFVQVIAADEGRGNFAFMPAYSSKLGAAGIKIVNIFPGNRERGEATTIGQVLLMDDKNGEVLALMDGSFITKFRTGAASGAAFKLLQGMMQRLAVLLELVARRTASLKLCWRHVI